ncbi:CHASE2 domain-containing sensor protein/signal transduction histidine kinase [Pseudomonas sp. PvR086]|jgi:CHASE2 domain-containing sensor protein/signal transduction histidine kinase|uniref:CHASE2 domain-containing protein n=1 Tax=Pseudomonas TaxID=286 RepID=UPI000B34AA3B|nr:MULTISPECIES: CHASE2 domain-containing protein [Pseudomonas]MBD9608711.1 CHASE2 domain-containing protein [Pseudomonas sp. PDM08]MDR7108579.1 CHASE2 domain-containing sensor protein/signal transduction histidine kinase [Pseudomonas frederiksbergensis]PMY54540.1 CHASE2 domain-containing protein [Pseudomonas sp. FW305-53]PMY87945.1 CHASE2 domain-containing protein [Pseudomonas sp. FW303-C2]PMY93107.1 CHASE2 domain-containing protein [Pseudomonas sp. FW305-62]
MKGRPRKDGREPTQAQRLFRRMVREWLWVSLILLPLTAVLSMTHGLVLSNLLYDNLRRLSPLPVDPRILIVTIDDYSLQQLGKWPWSRAMHAQLLDRLGAANAKGILFDVIFSEPDSHPGNDQLLAQAACRAGNVFVPLLREGVARYGQPLGEIEPVAPLSHCVKGIGHINAQADADGIVRSVYLSEGPAQQTRAQLAWLLYEQTLTDKENVPMPGTPALPSTQGWQRAHKIRIPFIRSDAGFPSVPYVSVLRGEVPPELLRDRLILIGSTAPGLGDRYVTPQSASMGTTPGIEIQANILNGLLQQRNIVALDERLAALLSVVIVGELLGLMLVRPRRALWLTLGAMAVALLGSSLLLRLGWWWSPAASLLGMLLGYLIWNWRRLNAVLAYFGWELARLDSEPKVFPERRRTQAPAGDVLQGQIVALEQAMSRTRDTRRFIADGLEYLPVATLISDPNGRILLANRKAREIFSSSLVGEEMLEQLSELGYPVPSDGTLPALSTLELLEFRDTQARSLRLDLAPLLPAEGDSVIGWLLSLTDLSVERDAEEQRAVLLRFLSHDLRAPHSAILALLDVQRHQVSGDTQVFSQIELQVRKALNLTEAFVQLAKAESEAYQFQPSMFAMLLLDTFDQASSIAHLKNIQLLHDLDEDAEALVLADQSLLTRALFNLLENAIKYSPAGSRITVRVSCTEGWLTCEIVDQGRGIAVEELPELFSQYRRFASAHGSDGLGLGLSMVKAVVDRHGGRISCHSVVGQGTTFSVQLPLLSE